MASRSMSAIAALVMGVATLFLVQTPAHAVDQDGIFELDANAVDDGSVAGDDWDVVNLGGGGDSVASTGVLSDPAPVTIFTGGGSKDYADIGSWRHKNGSVPDKDNITNAYAAAYNVDGDLVVYFGADRFANDGDAQLGFWFFQQNVTVNPNGSFNGAHVVGDVLVLANFEQGGGVPTIQILRWVGTGGDQHAGTLQLLETATGAECGTIVGAHDVCAITNRLPTGAPWPYTPKQGPAGTFPVVSFFEGGVNITQIFEHFRGTAPCFASFLAETRSSTSVAAVLKDFVLGAFPVCKIRITKNCEACELNAAQTAFVYTFSGTVTNDGLATLFDVTVVCDPGTPSNPGDDRIFLLGTLGGGQSANYGGTFESSLNPPTISARVSASTSPGGPATVTADSGTTVCPVCVKPPGINVTKECETVLTVLDNLVVVEVLFSGQVCNTGAIRLENVKVTDDSGTPDDPSDDEVFLIGNLAVRECKPYGGSYFPRTSNPDPRQARFTDTVKATGTAPLGFGTAEDTATADCPLCPP